MRAGSLNLLFIIILTSLFQSLVFSQEKITLQDIQPTFEEETEISIKINEHNFRLLLLSVLVSRLLEGGAMWLQKIKLSLSTMHSHNFQKYHRTLHLNRHLRKIQFDDLKIQCQKALIDFLRQKLGQQFH